MTQKNNISDPNDIPDWLREMRDKGKQEAPSPEYFRETKAALKNRIFKEEDIRPKRGRRIRLYTAISLAAAACALLLMIFIPGETVEYPADSYTDAEKLFIEEYSYYEIADLQTESSVSDTSIENYLMEENNYYEMINLY